MFSSRSDPGPSPRAHASTDPVVVGLGRLLVGIGLLALAGLITVAGLILFGCGAA